MNIGKHLNGANVWSSKTYRELDAETIKKQWLDSIPKCQNVMFFVLLWKPRGVSIPLLGPLICSCFVVGRPEMFPYYWVTDAHGVLKESTSRVASRSANMSIASHQEDKVE